MPVYVGDVERGGRPCAQEAPLISRIRGEFHEMPGMRLTFDQAVRLWALDRQTCECMLERLVAAGFLLRDHRGLYSRAHGGY